MWEQKQEIRETTVIKAQFVTNKADHGLDMEQRIRYHFQEEIAKELEKYISIEQRYSPINPFETVFNAEITVVPAGDTNCIINENVYKVKDKEFSHRQIEKAVMNSYPEYFL